DLSLIDPSDVRRDMGLLNQNAHLFYGTIRENLTLGAPLATDEEILRALVVTGALPFVQEKKEGLDHLILEGGVGFSGGQKQALLLARLLIRQPNILLLDEPTAAIDDVAEKQLIDHLKGWLAHRTLVVATHRRAVLELVDRIIVVNEGKIVMDGPRDQVLNQSTAQQKQVSQGGNS
ncbi:ATP-binding cassette domain-containing protein, partial [Acinetobacter pittii]